MGLARLLMHTKIVCILCPPNEHPGVANDDHQGGVDMQPEYNIPAEPLSSGTGPLYKYLRSEILIVEMCQVTDNIWIRDEDISGELELKAKDNIAAIYNSLALGASDKFIDDHTVEESCNEIQDKGGGEVDGQVDITAGASMAGDDDDQTRWDAKHMMGKELVPRKSMQKQPMYKQRSRGLLFMRSRTCGRRTRGL
jgi:hypothetical protein